MRFAGTPLLWVSVEKFVDDRATYSLVHKRVTVLQHGVWILLVLVWSVQKSKIQEIGRVTQIYTSFTSSEQNLLRCAYTWMTYHTTPDLYFLH